MDDRIEGSLLAVVFESETGSMGVHERARLNSEIERISQRGGTIVCPPGVNVYRRVGNAWEPLPNRGPEFGVHTIAGKIRECCCKTLAPPKPNPLKPSEVRQP